MKTILAIIITIWALNFYNKAKKQAEIEEADKKNQAKNERDNQIITTFNNIATASSAKKAATTLGLSYAARTGMLPVYADDWKDITTITKDYWPTFQQALNKYGVNYNSLYRKLEKYSSPIAHTGFYKHEFDNIRGKLEERLNW